MKNFPKEYKINIPEEDIKTRDLINLQGVYLQAAHRMKKFREDPGRMEKSLYRIMEAAWEEGIDLKEITIDSSLKLEIDNIVPETFLAFKDGEYSGSFGTLSIKYV